MKITGPQLARLQTLCSQMARSVVGFESTREARLAWANAHLQLGGDDIIQSFKDLSIHQARVLIDAAQAEVGHVAPLKPRSRAKQRLTTDADRAGNDGRRDDSYYIDKPEMVAAFDLGVIASYYHRLGWDKARFDAWLASGRSPIKPAKQIRTVRHANRVRWALKGMLKSAGLWDDPAAHRRAA